MKKEDKSTQKKTAKRKQKQKQKVWKKNLKRKIIERKENKVGRENQEKWKDKKGKRT